MIDELEKRIRKLAEVPDGPLFGHDLERYEFAIAAAGIGADIEREECAKASEAAWAKYRPEHQYAGHDCTDAIRARGKQ